MKTHVVKHFYSDHKKLNGKLLLRFLRKKRNRKKMAKQIHFERVLAQSPIKKMAACEILKTAPKIILKDFFSRNGNLSTEELCFISSLIVERKPRKLLEIGTFDGNTSLQMALNSPEGAIIHTIDLPPGEAETFQPVLDSDLQFIADTKKQVRKFETNEEGAKVKQHFGDSTSYNFENFEGPLDFIFIDGGHSYECVKSDSEKALQHLAREGVILWHDFTPHFEGVFRYLCELSEEIPLIHVEGTNLVLFSSKTK